MSMMQMLLGAAGATGEKYWYKNFNDPSTQENYANNSKTVVTADAIYWAVVSYEESDNEDGQSVAVIKMDKDGAIQWCSKLDNSGTSGDDHITLNGMDVDSNGNIYVAFRAGPTSSLVVYIYKLDPSDGTLESFNNRSFYPTGTLSGYISIGSTGNSLWVDSNDNVYVTGKHNSSPSYIPTMKYNSSGTYQWCTRIVPSDTSSWIYLMTFTQSFTDSDGNTYVVGYRYDNTTNYNQFAECYKYNSSGTFQWLAKWKSSDAGTWESCRARTVCTDSSGNVYVGGETTDEGQGQYNQLTCINSSGTIQWHKTFTSDVSTTSLDEINGITVDSDDKLYITFGAFAEGDESNVKGIVIKFDPSNQSIVWVRRWTYSGTGVYGNMKVTIDTTGDDDVMLVNYRSNESDPFGDALKGYWLWRLPVDGTLTGTHGDWSYVVPIDPNNNNAVITFGVSTSDASTPSETNSTDTSGTYNSTDYSSNATLDTSFDINTLVSVS